MGLDIKNNTVFLCVCTILLLLASFVFLGFGLQAKKTKTEENLLRQEEMSEKAEEICLFELADAIYKDIDAAKQTYVGNVYKASGLLSSVKRDYCCIANAHVYLPQEVLEELKAYRGQVVHFIGKIDRLQITKHSYNEDLLAVITFENAFYVGNTTGLTGPITGFGSSESGEAYCIVDYTKVYLDQKILDTLEEDTVITVSGVIAANPGNHIDGNIFEMKNPEWAETDADKPFTHELHHMIMLAHSSKGEQV